MISSRILRSETTGEDATCDKTIVCILMLYPITYPCFIAYNVCSMVQESKFEFLCRERPRSFPAQRCRPSSFSPATARSFLSTSRWSWQLIFLKFTQLLRPLHFSRKSATHIELFQVAKQSVTIKTMLEDLGMDDDVGDYCRLYGIEC